MTEHETISNDIERTIFPMPDSGATIPPRRKGIAPNKAEAIPLFSFTEFNARVIATGVSIPMLKSIKKSMASNIGNGHPRSRADEANRLVANSPITLSTVVFCRFFIFVTTLLPITNPKALQAKHTLYCIAVSWK